MNVLEQRMYRLTPRGGAGLVCDRDGVALGPVALAWAPERASGKRGCDVLPPPRVARVLEAAYGPQTDEVVQRLHRGLCRAAAGIEAGHPAGGYQAKRRLRHNAPA